VFTPNDRIGEKGAIAIQQRNSCDDVVHVGARLAWGALIG